jgi:integrase/DNA-directed RNA polymerase subunit RPC12/RpoP
MIKMESVECPSCKGKRIWKDGLRYNEVGSIQRYVCRDCGFRFSEKRSSSKHVGRIPTKAFFNSSSLTSNCQVSDESKRRACVSLAVGEKNLAEVETRTEKRAAGATGLSNEIKGKLVEYAWWMKKEGYSEATIKARTMLLTILAKRGANLLDPESVKEAIAKQEWSEGSKLHTVKAYDLFAFINNITWNPPNYKQNQKLPFIPLESELDQLIASCGKKTAALLQLLKETGMRVGEAWRLKWTNIDAEHNTITLNEPEKNSNARMFKVSSKLISMLNMLPKKSDKVFGYTPLQSVRLNLWRRRKSVARKLQNPRIEQITFHTFRHWKATMEYQRTKDILYVKQLLGHKSINNTLIYTQLVNFESDEYHVRVAKTLKEACELAEAGFEYFTTIEGVQVFRKRK